MTNQELRGARRWFGRAVTMQFWLAMVIVIFTVVIIISLINYIIVFIIKAIFLVLLVYLGGWLISKLHLRYRSDQRDTKP